jgi:hypothetical protein
MSNAGVQDVHSTFDVDINGLLIPGQELGRSQTSGQVEYHVHSSDGCVLVVQIENRTTTYSCELSAGYPLSNGIISYPHGRDVVREDPAAHVLGELALDMTRPVATVGMLVLGEQGLGVA